MEFNNKKKICRACLTEQGTFQSVFQVENNSGSSLLISEMLTAFATIQLIQGDGLPEQICTKCSEQTAKMYLFKINCEKSDSILRARLESGQLHYEENPLEEPQDKTKNSITSPKIKVESDDSFQNDTFINFVSVEYNDNSSDNEKEIKDSKYLTLNRQNNRDDSDNQTIKTDESKIKCEESEENVFSCPECDFVFVFKENLDNHLVGFHGKKDSEESSCNDSFETEQESININSQFKGNLFIPPNSDKSYECDTCKKQFKTISNLKRHKKTHFEIKSYECDVCLKKFACSSYLTSHKIIHSEKQYECDICQKKLITSQSLKRHKRIHTDEKPYECEICQKKFASSAYLSIHKIIHGEKQYECDVCLKKLITLQSLKRHKRIHTGEKPYECDVCNMKFLTTSHLSYHKKNHTGKKTFECDICSNKFITLQSLNRHKRTHMRETS